MALTNGGSRKKSSPAMLEAKQRQHQALELRLAGATLEAIAGKLGYHDSAAAYKAIQVVMAENVAAPSAELREIEVRRLDKLIFAIWPAAMKGDLGAVDRVLKIAERRARLLGLDAPLQIALNDSIRAMAREEGLTDEDAADALEAARRIVAGMAV